MEQSSQRYITLPDGHHCSLGKYVEAWSILRGAYHNSNVSGFDHFPMTAPEVLRELRYGMHDRINRHIPGHGIGRKWDQNWQRAALQTALAVNTPRLIVRYCPPDFRVRLAHRITTADQD